MSARVLNAIWWRWLHDAKRAGRVAVTAEEAPSAAWSGTTAWRFGPYFPVDDEDGVGAFEILLEHWSEGDIVESLAALQELADDVEALPTDIEEVRKLALVHEIHDL